jgi:hypothetical protein
LYPRKKSPLPNEPEALCIAQQIEKKWGRKILTSVEY